MGVAKWTFWSYLISVWRVQFYNNMLSNYVKKISYFRVTFPKPWRKITWPVKTSFDDWVRQNDFDVSHLMLVFVSLFFLMWSPLVRRHLSTTFYGLSSFAQLHVVLPRKQSLYLTVCFPLKVLLKRDLSR